MIALPLLLLCQLFHLLLKICLCLDPQRSLCALRFINIHNMLSHWLIDIIQYSTLHISLFRCFLCSFRLYCLMGRFYGANWSRPHLKSYFKLNEWGIIRSGDICFELFLWANHNISLKRRYISKKLKHRHRLAYNILLHPKFILNNLHAQIHHVLEFT